MQEGKVRRIAKGGESFAQKKPPALLLLFFGNNKLAK